MGYKVYRGLVYDAATPEEVIADAALWRGRVGALSAEHKAAHYARAAVERLDDDAVGAIRDEEGGSPLERVEAAWRADMERDRAGYRHPDTDLEFLITLHLFEGRVYGMVRTERGRWFEEYRARPGVREFAYYDGADRPAERTEAEWDERRRIWSGIVKKVRASDEGREIDCSVDPGLPSDAAIEAALPGFDARLERVARDAARDVYVRDVAGLDFAAARMHKVIAAIHAASDWFETAPGRAELDRQRARLAPLLAPAVTAAMLRAAPAAVAAAGL